MIPINTYSREGVNDVMQNIAREMLAGCNTHGDPLDPFRPSEINGGTLRITDDSSSTDKGVVMLEMSALSHIWNPRDRLVYSKPIDVFNLVGLWNYLISGSDSASFIAFYNPIGRRFVDEEVSTTQLRANWGERLFASGAVDRCIALLKRAPGTRRAIIPVLQSEDVGFESRNLPCLASIQFAVRNGKLDAFVTMRSQSAIGVLPYDLFLLTMLHEYVADRADQVLGEYTHFTPLLGIRQREVRTMLDMVANPLRGEEMPRMEHLEPGQKALYLHCERDARLRGLLGLEAGDLPPYWRGLLRITVARHYYLKGYGEWQDHFMTATDAFPESFLLKNIPAAPRPTA